MTSLSDQLSDGLAVMVRITAKVGQEEALAQLLRDITVPSQAEPLMKAFVPYRSPDDPAEFFVYELYENRQGWEAHNQMPHFLNVVSHLVEKAAFRERLPFVPLG